MRGQKIYPAYKDSGVAWLGPVPSHWRISAVKWEFDSQLGKMLQPEKKQSSDEQVPYHKAVSVQWERVAEVPPEKMWANPTEIEKYRILKGDLLICEGGDVGRAAIFSGEDSAPIIIQNSIHRLRPLKHNANATLLRLMQVCRQSGWFDVLCSKATIVHFTDEKLGDLSFPVAPCAEQIAIATYLDRETARIDALITKKTRFIELLREKRQALITHAVTKGLDPNVNMKDSGVEWLGEVPEHWVVSKLKNCLREQLSYGANEAAEQDDPENPRFIRITDLNDDGTLKPETFKSLPFDVAAPYLLSEGDILLARSGATVGKSFLYSESMGPSCYAGYLIRARLSPRKMLPKYFWYIANSDYYWDFISGSNIQSTIQNVSGEKYGNLWVTLPTIAEQENIIARLDCEWRRFATLINRTERSIELLKERRSALITAAVTGQIDLREAA